jgi:hypothetical protein
MLLTFITDFKFWIVVIVQIVGFLLVCFKLYAKSYSTEKGKNLATKEDIGEITQIVESIKKSLAIETEELKSDLSYKNEHLIHLRAAERLAIINYYKATWVLVLNFTRPDLIKHEIDNFHEKNGTVSDFELRRYISETELVLNKIKEEVSNLKYLRDISESELMFFYDEQELTSITGELNLSLSELERALFRSINLLLQVFTEITVKINGDQPAKDIIIEAKRKRSDILADWYEERRNSLSFIRIFNENLKKTLLKRLMSLTS